MQEIVLAPLAREDVGQLVADSLHCDRERAAPLARLVHEKTAGNPFFAIQFLSALVEEGLLTFDHGAARWSWDLTRIHAKGYTDNVVDLMVGKLSRLPVDTQKALQQLACLGNSARARAAGDGLRGFEGAELHGDLEEALRTGLVLHAEGAYRFVHDRVQEAAYSLIPEAERAEAHLRIGRLLAAHTPPEKREEAIFEIVNQLNRGAALITSHDEREQLAELNLIAGKRAKASTAYASALSYLVAGAALAGGRRLGAPAGAHVRAGAAPGRMRVPDRRTGGGGGALDDALVARRRSHRSKRPSPACGWTCTRRSAGATARSTSVSPTSVIWAWSGRRIRPKRKRDANTSGRGRCSEAARSRSSSICP